MRLLHTETLTLHDFTGHPNQPYYAILSHRWESEEVIFQDISDVRQSWRSMIGAGKIIKCCEQAAKDGWEYVVSHFLGYFHAVSSLSIMLILREGQWIDSCCIDKSSSSELSEAINSMFQWYAAAQVCYAYLSDVTISKDNSRFKEEFCRSQ